MRPTRGPKTYWLRMSKTCTYWLTRCWSGRPSVARRYWTCYPVCLPAWLQPSGGLQPICQQQLLLPHNPERGRYPGPAAQPACLCACNCATPPPPTPGQPVSSWLVSRGWKQSGQGCSRPQQGDPGPAGLYAKLCGCCHARIIGCGALGEACWWWPRSGSWSTVILLDTMLPPSQQKTT